MEQKEKLPEKPVFTKCDQCGFPTMFDDGVVLYCRICGHIRGLEVWQHPNMIEVGKTFFVSCENPNYDTITKLAVFCHNENIPFKITVLTRKRGFF